MTGVTKSVQDAVEDETQSLGQRLFLRHRVITVVRDTERRFNKSPLFYQIRYRIDRVAHGKRQV